MVLLNLSLSLITDTDTSPYAWIRTNVHFALLMAVSYELERRDLQVQHSTVCGACTADCSHFFPYAWP